LIHEPVVGSEKAMEMAEELVVDPLDNRLLEDPFLEHAERAIIPKTKAERINVVTNFECCMTPATLYPMFIKLP